MSTETHDTNNPHGHGDFERRDIGVPAILYFLAGLAAVTLLITLFLVGMYNVLDKRSKAQQPAVSPLITNVPADTRAVAPNYPETAFPDPRLETDERMQLDKIRLNEEQTLASYGWVDEKAGTVRIPIERAMDLVVERGLPTLQGAEKQEAAAQPPAAQPTAKKKGSKK
jgi:hypothetical protein